MKNLPRVVVVTRKTPYEELIARHATRLQAEFFLKQRGQSLAEVEAVHHRFLAAVAEVQAAIPLDWRRNLVPREDLDRFLFEPDDVVVVVGQDGLVANVAKYLSGQLVIGVNPTPDRFDGVLVRHPPSAMQPLLRAAVHGELCAVERCMVSAELDDGQRLCALNELFLGQRTHQSARYELELADQHVKHCSSGVIVATGTGATGWARSIHLERHSNVALPKPDDPCLAFFVREAFPSVSSSTDLTEGLIGNGISLVITSRMDNGVIFGDGIEADYLRFDWGVRARIHLAEQRLRLA
ncbi:MAG: hypothetical protein ACOY0T_33560 [Myxococcota bacterium]